jgi:hypothetical protein
MIFMLNNVFLMAGMLFARAPEPAFRVWQIIKETVAHATATRRPGRLYRGDP